LVALVDERDGLAAKATRDLKRLRRSNFVTIGTVIAEACFLLPNGYQRRRLRALLDRLGVAIVEIPSIWWNELFDWLDRYEEHEPDLADAQLAVLASRDRACRVWTYDREFRSTWRRTDGSRIPVAGAPTSA
jgi:predicted nucleic acid-binding protein